MPEPVGFEMDWAVFDRMRTNLGTGFVRAFGYFQEDGLSAIAKIELSVRSNDAAAVVLAAHKLKDDAGAFGALALESLAEDIEFQARDCIEWRVDTGGIVEHAVQLRPLFNATIDAIDAASNPLMQRRAPMGLRDSA